MKQLLGTDFILEIDTVTDPDTESRGTEANFKPVACWTSNGLSSSKAKQTTSNKCDGNNETSLPGIGSWSMSGDGQATELTVGEATTRENFETLLALHRAGTIFFARITNATLEPYREGKVWIETFEETMPNAEAYTFTAAFTGVGELFLAPVAP